MRSKINLHSRIPDAFRWPLIGDMAISVLIIGKSQGVKYVILFKLTALNPIRWPQRHVIITGQWVVGIMSYEITVNSPWPFSFELSLGKS